MFVPMANSPTRSLFWSVCVYFQKSLSSSRFSECASVSRFPTTRTVSAINEGPSWNYTTVLNIVFLMVAAALVVRFLRTGGPAMLRMMNTPEDEMMQHDQPSPQSPGSRAKLVQRYPWCSRDL